jgi:hypothetical protein
MNPQSRNARCMTTQRSCKEMEVCTFFGGRAPEKLSEMEVEVSHPMNQIVRNERSN